MCARYTPPGEMKDVERTFRAQLKIAKDVAFKPIIYPGYQAPVVIGSEENRRIEDRFWGLKYNIRGKRDPTQLLEKLAQNAVSETIHEKKTFKSAWEKSQRCVIVARNFFEPSPAHGGWASFHDAKAPLLAIAGIYDKTTWKNVEREAFTMLTCAPSPFMADIHDRMPVILNLNDVDEWLSVDTSPNEAKKLLKPYAGTLVAESA